MAEGSASWYIAVRISPGSTLTTLPVTRQLVRKRLAHQVKRVVPP